MNHEEKEVINDQIWSQIKNYLEILDTTIAFFRTTESEKGMMKIAGILAQILPMLLRLSLELSKKNDAQSSEKLKTIVNISGSFTKELDQMKKSMNLTKI